MSKNRVDRRPGEKPSRSGGGTHAPESPERDRMPRDLEERKEIEKPAGRASDQPPRVSGAGGKGKDFFEGERSDRESGRPLQLEDDEDGEERNDQQSGRPVQLEERPSERPKDRQHRSAREVDSTKR